MADLTALRCFYPESASTPKMQQKCTNFRIVLREIFMALTMPSTNIEHANTVIWNPSERKKQIGDAYDTQSCTDNSCCPLYRNALHEPSTRGNGSTYLIA